MAKLIDIQEKLDKQKWVESKELGRDKSGKMPYCYKCKYQTTLTNDCIIPQTQREEQLVCAKAYRNLNKNNKSK